MFFQKIQGKDGLTDTNNRGKIRDIYRGDGMKSNEYTKLYSLKKGMQQMQDVYVMEESKDKDSVSFATLYQAMDAFMEIHPKEMLEIDSCNTAFKVRISNFGMDIILEHEDRPIIYLKCLRGMDNYAIATVHDSLTKLVQENQEKIIQKSFVKIEDCPNWLQGELREMRENELEKQMVIKK